MKKPLQLKTLLLLLIFVMQIYALDSNFTNDKEIDFFTTRNRINPFEMVSVGFNYAQYSHQKIFDTTGDGNIKNNSTNKIYTVIIETPIYKKYISYALAFSWLQNSETNKDGIFSKDPNDKDKKFPTILGHDTFLSVCGRLPIYLDSLGDIAITASSGIGLSIMLAGFANENSIIQSRLGKVVVFSYGIHYYPIKWLGVTFEIQNRFYDYKKDMNVKKSKKSNLYKRAFHYSTGNILAFGIKTIF